MAEQAKILVAEAEENNLSVNAWNERWKRWSVCSLCEQRYHGVVHCALGWACWKTYVGRPETDRARRCAMTLLGGGLHDADHHEDALVVKEAELSMERRLGGSENNILVTQGNLALTYRALGRKEEALRIRRGVYSGRFKLHGEEHEKTLLAANNYGASLNDLKRFGEAKSLFSKWVPLARRIFGENDYLTLHMRRNYARTLYKDDGSTLDDLREAVATLEDTARTARRVFGGAHPLTTTIDFCLRESRVALRAREETPSGA